MVSLSELISVGLYAIALSLGFPIIMHFLVMEKEEKLKVFL